MTPQHFSIEQAPEDEQEIVARNAHLANLGITAIWFEKGSFDYVENILKLAKNELRYLGAMPDTKKEPLVDEPMATQAHNTLIEKVKHLFS